MTKSNEDLILASPEVDRITIGRKREDGEIIYRYVIVYGNDELGYIASSEEWFSPNRNGGVEPEFYEVQFQTSIYPTTDEAVADAMPGATKEADAAGFKKRLGSPRPGNGGSLPGTATGPMTGNITLSKSARQQLRIITSALGKKPTKENCTRMIESLIRERWSQLDEAWQEKGATSD